MSTAKPNILLIGEPMRDIYHIGTAVRQSPEAPVPVVTITQTLELPGGADNVRESLEALGADVETFYSTYWDRWPRKHRLMVGGTQFARWDEQDSLPALELDPRHLRLQEFDAIVISDYGKGSFTLEVRQQLADLTMAAGTPPVFVDTKSNPLDWSPRFTFFPNRKEYQAWEKEYQQTPFVVETLGPKGMVYFEFGKHVFQIPAAMRNPSTVIGAGDCTIAAFAYARALGMANIEALQFATYEVAKALRNPYTAVAERTFNG